jgi:quinol monooxygenase YgiN
MTNEKVIMLIEAKIQPQHRAELVEAARQYLPLVRAEPGVEAFYLTVREDAPNTFVFLRDLQVASRTGFPSATGLH